MTKRKAFPTEEDILSHLTELIEEWLMSNEDTREFAERLYKLMRSYL